MKLTSILVATDFSAHAHHAAQRAALLAREQQVRKAVLLHVVPRSMLSAVLRSSAIEAMERTLAQLAGELKRSTGFAFEPRVARGPVVDELVRASSRFDLVVAGARGMHPLRDFALGTSVERMLRKLQRPVLVVKRKPAGPYRRALVPVDFSADARATVELAGRLAPGAELNLLHAFEVVFEGKMRFAGVAEENLLYYRRHARAQAQNEMQAMIAALALPAERITRTIAHGYPPRLIAKAEKETRADLVAIGKHGKSALEDLLLGSVTLHALAESACDVLVVPASEKAPRAR